MTNDSPGKTGPADHQSVSNITGVSGEQSSIIATGASRPEDAEVLRCLREAVMSGYDWYLALLKAIGQWTSATEEYEGRTWVYLIDGEAFDWLLLAERLCLALDGLIPEYERDTLLFQGIVPVDLDPGEVKKLIGEKKYRQYLNFYYGITVEEGLLLAVQEEIEKEMRSRCLRHADGSDDAYLRVYDAGREELLREFRKEKARPNLKSTSLTELKEFTYWLFKYRFKRCEKARIASDTRKALAFLNTQWRRQGVFGFFGTEAET